MLEWESKPTNLGKPREVLFASCSYSLTRQVRVYHGVVAEGYGYFALAKEHQKNHVRLIAPLHHVLLEETYAEDDRYFIINPCRKACWFKSDSSDVIRGWWNGRHGGASLSSTLCYVSSKSIKRKGRRRLLVLHCKCSPPVVVTCTFPLYTLKKESEMDSWSILAAILFFTIMILLLIKNTK